MTAALANRKNHKASETPQSDGLAARDCLGQDAMRRDPQQEGSSMTASRQFTGEERRRIVAAFKAGEPMQPLAKELNSRAGALKLHALRAAPEPFRHQSVSPRIFLADIVAHVAAVFGFTPTIIRGRCKIHEVCVARFAVCHLAKELASQTLSATGRYLGGRDHTTIMHARDRCAAMMADEPTYRAKVEEAREAILARKAIETPAPEIIVSEPQPAFDDHDWWELSDDEFIASRIAEHKAAGGDFVEVYA